MAKINNLHRGFKEQPSVHDNVDATYYILDFPTGNKILQIDSVGRRSRKIPGKVSQSIQFSPEAIRQLKKILQEFD